MYSPVGINPQGGAAMQRWSELYEAGELGPKTAHEDRTVLFRRGDEASASYFLRAGAVEILQSSEDGLGVLVKILLAPTLFGAIEPLGGEQRYLENVRVLGSADTVHIPRSRFLQLISTDPRASFETLVDAGSAFCVRANLELARLYPIEVTLAAVLVGYAEACGEPDGDRVIMGVKRTQEDLAMSIGAGERSVSRHLSGWKKSGLIDKRGGRYILCEVERLTEMAEPLHSALLHRWRAPPM